MLFKPAFGVAFALLHTCFKAHVQAAPIITIAPATLLQGTAGTAFSQTLTASGGTAPYTFAITTGALPSGLSLSPSGVISGTPSQSGNFQFTATATDSSPDPGPYSGSRSYVLTIQVGTLTITPSTLPQGNVGSQYSQTLVASGGSGPYTFAVTAGALPPGLTFSPSGAVSGTPQSSGSFTFTARATTSDGNYSGSRTYTLGIQPAPPTIVVSPASLPDGVVGTAFEQTLTASGGTAPFTFAITAGALPPGLSFSTTGQLSGTPSAKGTFQFTVAATDASSSPGPYSGSRSFALVIDPGVLTVNPSTLPDAYAGQHYGQSLGASGSTPPYSFAITQGSLPPGLTFESTGAIMGYAHATGQFTFTVTAQTYDGNYVGSRQYTLTVNDVPIVISQCASPKTVKSAGETCVVPDFTQNDGLGFTGSVNGIDQSPTAGSTVTNGTNNVVITANDAYGGAPGSCTTTLTCITPPVFTKEVPAFTATSSSDSICTLDIPDFVANTTVLGATSVVQSPAAGQAAQTGSNQVAITASNSAGSVSYTTTFTCALNDFAPMIQSCALPAIVNSTSDTTCTVSLPDLTNALIVNGTAPITVEQSPTPGSTLAAGNTSVTLKATNDKGSDSCVTVVDCQLAYFAPTIQTCANPITLQSNSSTVCDQTMPNFLENDGFSYSGTQVKVSQSPYVSAALAPGSTEVYLSATNKLGNASCQTSVTCVLAKTPDTCSPSFQNFPNNITVDIFSDTLPEVTGTPGATANCCSNVTVSFLDTIKRNRKCRSQFSVAREWTATNTCNQQATHETQTISFKQPGAPLFGKAAPFQLYATQNINIKQSKIAGQIAAGQQVTIDHSTIGRSDVCTYTRNSLVSKIVRAKTSQVYYGNVAASKTFVDRKSEPFQSVRQSPLDAARIDDVLRSSNTRLAKINSNGTVCGKGDLRLKGESSLYNVFTLSGGQLAHAKTLHIAVPSDSLVLINVQWPGGNLKWPLTKATVPSSNILFNFVGPSSLHIVGGTIIGSILAPDTKLSLSATILDGQVAAKSISADNVGSRCGIFAGNNQCGWQGGRFGPPYSKWIPV